MPGETDEEAMAKGGETKRRWGGEVRDESQS